MIKAEETTINNEAFIKTYSDENYYIKKVGTDEIYSEAVDLPLTSYTYEETTEKIISEKETITNGMPFYGWSDDVQEM